MKIQVRRVRAWDQDGAPVVWGFFNTYPEMKSIFNEVSKLTESIHTKEHQGKFYYNGIGGFWYTRCKKSVDMAKEKLEEEYDKAQVYVTFNIIK